MDSPGKIGYEAYCRRSDGKSLVSGAKLPAWDELKDEIRQAWDFAACAVLSASAGIYKLWYVGQSRGGEFPDCVWDFQGVFSSEDLAKAACREPSYFISPILLNEELPHESVETPGYFPLRDAGPNPE